LALLCKQPQETGGCGRCSSCLRVESEQHPDCHRLERQRKSDGNLERVIRIAQVRELQNALSLKSFEGARRLIIINEAERMNAFTANALLKTLEEPGEGTHFILLSSAPQRLLPTIISRCQHLRFAPLSKEVLIHHLKQQLSSKGTELELLADLAEGSIGRGLQLAASPLLPRRLEIIDLLYAPQGARRIPQVLELAEELAKKKAELPLLFHLLRSWSRDLAFGSQQLQRALIHKDRLSLLKLRCAEQPLFQILKDLQRINQTEFAVTQTTAQVRLSLESLFLSLLGAK